MTEPAETIADASKDELILAALAALGGEARDVNERDLFLAAWHAFPNTMRWVDTALPNPDTFTASLRRLDQRGAINRVGKQQRGSSRRGRRRGAFEPGRSGVVKARIVDGGLDRGGVTDALVQEVRGLMPSREDTASLSDGALIAICASLRADVGRHIDEPALVELAFHKFPARFAYQARPEFPDTERVRNAIGVAIDEGLLTRALELTRRGERIAGEWQQHASMRIDQSSAHAVGELKLAARVEQSNGFRGFADSGTLALTKADELHRMLRIPPSNDPRPLAKALVARARGLRRIDKGGLAEYLEALAQRHNPEVATLARELMSEEDGQHETNGTGGSA